jgi:NAD(P)H-hydrate epimerase
MTKGGYGDLLAGVAGALLARGNTAFESAKAAAYIVGSAGEIASTKLGEGMLASDVLENLPGIIRQTRR